MEKIDSDYLLFKPFNRDCASFFESLVTMAIALKMWFLTPLFILSFFVVSFLPSFILFFG